MLVKCASCQNVFESQAYGEVACPQCGAHLMVQQPPTLGVPLSSGGMPPPGTSFNDEATVEQNRSTPWEERATRGFWNGLYETAKQSIQHPVLFFRGMRVDHHEGALSYYWILYAVSLLVAMVPFGLFFMTIPLYQRSLNTPEFNKVFGAIGLSLPALGGIWLVLVLLLVPVFFYLGAGILHLIAKLWGAKGPFDATLRVVAYSVGPVVFSFVPYVGGIAAAVFGAILIINGLRWNHRISLGKAVGIYCTPVLLGCCCWMMLWIGVMAPLMAKMSLMP